MNMDLSMVRVALYAANVGKNIHLLRVPTMKHVFIGHGDSDKLASVNPFSKVYDEVWTMRPRGPRPLRHRRRRHPRRGHRRGRPPAARAHRALAGHPQDSIPTVLYAPTWEGWDDDPGNTSILLVSVNIVKKLVTAEPPVRVLYKPHPFTGSRSAKARAAHQRITALVKKAAAERAADPASPRTRPPRRRRRPS